MKRLSRTRLFLLEMLVNLLVFCVGAAVCLLTLSRAYSLSAQSRVLTQAQRVAENAAMAFRATNGNLTDLPNLLSGRFSDDMFVVWYSQDWQPVREENAIYRLTISSRRVTSNVIHADIQVLPPQGDAVTKLIVSEYVGSPATEVGT